MNDTLIRLCGLYENTSSKTGRRYFVGYLGGAKLLLLEDTKAAEGQPGWSLCIAERPPKGEPRRETPLAARHRLAAEAQALTGKTGHRPAPAAADDPAPFDDTDGLALIGR